MEVKSDTVIRINDILVGEVWICSGQSNMQQTLRGYNNQPTENGNRDILLSANNNIRMFTVERVTADQPAEKCEGSWEIASPATAVNFSAAGYYFARDLHAVLGVPIGMIHTSWGGTNSEAWTSKETLAKFDPEIMFKSDRPPHQKSVLFNGMISPLIPYAIKGAIWYQGESNRQNPVAYGELFPAMITDWRTHWGQGDFPFYFVQIAPYKYDGGMTSAIVRESQMKTMEKVPNAGMAVTMDIGNYECIHPPKKAEVGQRLALWALAKDYGIEGISYSGPIYKSVDFNEGKAIITFDHADGGLSTLDQELEGLEIAGADKKFQKASYSLNGKGQLVVWSENVPDPKAVRYGWSDWVDGRLYNALELPASSFRTDNWE